MNDEEDRWSWKGEVRASRVIASIPKLEHASE